MGMPSMYELFYEPWKGDRYNEQPHRLLLLGESHYGDSAEHADATIKNTKEFVRGEWNPRFWTNVTAAVLGKPSTIEERPDFWDTVAFYNYVQRSAGSWWGIAPNREMFRRSEGAFYQVLDLLKPHAILVLSTRLWNRLPDEGPRSRRGEPLIINGDQRLTWRYRHDAGEALTTWIPHPSYFFVRDRWHKWISALIEASREV